MFKQKNFLASKDQRQMKSRIDNLKKEILKDEEPLK